ncbi:hypothetical protein HDU96_006571 [Phlyctochytrium bullatum]|nr:hypothetical protein HDU96_006571 [Phlyctochytrium bullatum]
MDSAAAPRSSEVTAVAMDTRNHHHHHIPLHRDGISNIDHPSHRAYHAHHHHHHSRHVTSNTVKVCHDDDDAHRIDGWRHPHHHHHHHHHTHHQGDSASEEGHPHHHRGGPPTLASPIGPGPTTSGPMLIPGSGPTTHYPPSHSIGHPVAASCCHPAAGCHTASPRFPQDQPPSCCCHTAHRYSNNAHGCCGSSLPMPSPHPPAIRLNPEHHHHADPMTHRPNGHQPQPRQIPTPPSSQGRDEDATCAMDWYSRSRQLDTSYGAPSPPYMYHPPPPSGDVYHLPSAGCHAACCSSSSSGPCANQSPSSPAPGSPLSTLFEVDDLHDTEPVSPPAAAPAWRPTIPSAEIAYRSVVSGKITTVDGLVLDQDEYYAVLRTPTTPAAVNTEAFPADPVPRQALAASCPGPSTGALRRPPAHPTARRRSATSGSLSAVPPAPERARRTSTPYTFPHAHPTSLARLNVDKPASPNDDATGLLGDEAFQRMPFAGTAATRRMSSGTEALTRGMSALGVGCGAAVDPKAVAAHIKIAEDPLARRRKGGEGGEVACAAEEDPRRRFECETCGQMFVQLAHLKIHLRRHTGERPYECKHCGKAFNQKGNLRTHLRKHTGDKPFKCEFEGCDKAFSQMGNLRTHEKLHQNVKRFSCNLCEKQFSQLGNLKAHISKVHARVTGLVVSAKGGPGAEASLPTPPAGSPIAALPLGLSSVAAMLPGHASAARREDAAMMTVEGITPDEAEAAMVLASVSAAGTGAEGRSKYPLLNENTGGYTSTISDLKPDTLQPVVLKSLLTNPFCAGHSQAADGSIWMFGGDRQPSNDSSTGFFLYPGIWGRRRFVPPQVAGGEAGAEGLGVWENENAIGNMSMGDGRWYPTVVTMYDESAFIVGGYQKNLDFGTLNPDDHNPTFEYFNPARNGSRLEILDWAWPHTLYPIAFQLPSKKLFLMVSNKTITIEKEKNDEVTQLETLNPDTPHEPFIYPNTPTAVMLPMYEETGYRAVVMVCGGVTKGNSTWASNHCYSYEPDAPGAKWKRMADMPRGRLMPDSVLLPDGTILFTNGVRWGVAGGNAGQSQYAAGPHFDTDLYLPSDDRWRAGVGRSVVARMYHSGAILLEDASVVTTGSEMANYLDVWGRPDRGPEGITGAEVQVDISNSMNANPSIAYRPGCFPQNGNASYVWSKEDGCTLPYEFRVERYVPPYMASGVNRPTIRKAPATAPYDTVLSLELDPSVKVATVALIRYTTTTHSTNTDQRFLGPKVLFNNGTHVFFKTPPTAAIAPPGNYHLFVVTAEGVPSVARRVLLNAAATAEAVVLPATTAAAGGSSTGRETATDGSVAPARPTTAPQTVKPNGAGVGREKGVVAAVVVGAAVMAAVV